VDFYCKRFEGTPLTQSPEVIALEGRLFGYPSCCVDTFIHHPYAANGFDARDQEILFHWACPRCTPTAILLREYRRAHADCLRLFPIGKAVPRPRSWGAPVARSAASLALLAGMAGAASAADSHWLPAPDDVDSDYLSHAEEILRGTNLESADTDENGILDGVQTAHLLWQLVLSPPSGVEVVQHLARGTETCQSCGALVNMGFVTVTHHDRGLSADLPYVALHSLEHGCLQHLGTLHEGRVELDTLKRILFSHDPAHFLPALHVDTDGDGLEDAEEPLLSTDPGDPDTDGDSLQDGPQTAEDLLAQIAALPRQETPDGPYLLEHGMDGLEQCMVCGATYNMGIVEIVNPLEQIAIPVPMVALHALAHGSFTYEGTHNEGRLSPTALRTVLTGSGHAHWIPVSNDADADGLTADEEPHFGTSDVLPDEDGNGTPDGRQLAVSMALQIGQLPEGPISDQTYLLHNMTLGVYPCLTCGESINMGFVRIVDPLNARSTDVPYYNLHFMEKGSFSTDREDLYGRVDPREIGDVLGVSAASVDPVTPTVPALRSAPNPFRSTGGTTIVLSLPATDGSVEVTIYDSAGKAIRELYRGEATDRTMRFSWDGRDREGTPAPAGTYYCRAKSEARVLTGKITLIP
jgi:hypothetical protein